MNFRRNLPQWKKKSHQDQLTEKENKRALVRIQVDQWGATVQKNLLLYKGPDSRGAAERGREVIKCVERRNCS